MARKSVGAVALGAALAVALAAQARQKDKEKPKPKDAKPAGTELLARLVKVDVEKGALTVTDEAGKRRDFAVTDDTRAIGPRGGVSRDRLKDDRFTPGAELKRIGAPCGRALGQVEVPPRKSDQADPTDRKSAGGAEGGKAGANPPAAKNGAVKGRVTENGRPQPDLVVLLRDEGDARAKPRQARTDGRGQYSFEGVAPGQYRLEAYRPDAKRPGATKKAAVQPGPATTVDLEISF